MKTHSHSRLRRLLTLLAALALLTAVLAGCNRDSASDDPTDPPPVQSTTGTEQTDPTTGSTDPEETEEPTEEPEPTAALPDAVMGTVTADNLNVRSNPSTDSTILKRLAKDTRVTILEQRTIDKVTWGRITEGWIMMNYVLLDGETPPEPTEPESDNQDSGNNTSTGTTGTGTITASELNIRKSNSADSDSVGKYKKGDQVKILETKGNWGRTDKGWISLKYVKMDGASDTTPDIGDETTNSEIVSDGKTSALGYGVVDLGALNVRTGPGTKYDKVGTVTEGSRYAYYQKSGNWVRIKDGWVSTSYFYIEGTTADDAATGTITATELNLRSGPGASYKSTGVLKQGETVHVLAQVDGWGYTSKGWVSMKYVKVESAGIVYSTGKGTITASELNIRKDASKDSDKVGTYKKGDAVEILEVKGEWGRTDKGWISMKYVSMGATTTPPATGTNTTYKTGTGTVNVNSSLTIRKDANKDSEKVGSYANGDKVTIQEVKGEWGKTNKGWINLKYVKFD